MQIVNIEGFNIIGISIRTSNSNGQAAREIGALWERFLAEDIKNKIPNKVNGEVLSLYNDYEGDHTKPYTAILGCKVSSLDQIPVGMAGAVVDGGKYFKTSAKGEVMEVVGNQWRMIFESDWPRNYQADFEVYGEKASNPADAEVDFYVGVKESVDG